MYSCYDGHQLASSSIFGLSYNSIDWNTNAVIPTEISFIVPAICHSIYITNTAFTGLTIKNGDSYSKKFGGVSGNDPDWFLLDIIGYNNAIVTDTVHFYLADYRFVDNLQDYIIKEWTNIDLTILGQVTKLDFKLSSSDTGSYGMNTPAYFCFDNFNCDFITNVTENKSELINVFPNPTTDKIYFNKEVSNITICNLSGEVVYLKTENSKNIDISQLNAGIYFIKMTVDGVVINEKIIKK